MQAKYYYVMILFMSSFRVASNQGWYSQGKSGRKKVFLKLVRESQRMSGSLKRKSERFYMKRSMKDKC